MKNFILINDTTTQNNWGCHSTTYHTLLFLKRSGFNRKYSIKLQDLFNQHATLAKINQFILDDVGLVFINGEGSIYDRQEKGMNILRSIKAIKQKKPDIKVFFLNSTFDLGHKAMSDGVREVSKDVLLFCARENISLKNLKDIKIDNSVLQPDFLYEEIQFENYENEEYIVIGGNSNYYRSDRQPFDAVAAYDKLAGSLLAEGHQIKLYSSDLADIKFLRLIEKKYNLEHITCSSTDWKAALEILSRAKISISGRYHPSIMSLCGMTPSYFISANNCKMLGTNYYVYDNRDNFSESHSFDKDVTKITEWVKKVSSNYESEVKNVENRMKKVKEMLEQSKTLILEKTK